jgi:CheY-like chemotaxis protein
MFTILLQSETPYQIVSFTQGTQVLENLETLQAAVPDLFLLDYSLPDMTGLQLYDWLHALAELAHVPALLITARTLPPEIQQVLQQRQIRMLAKPFDLDELLRTLEEILTKPK